MFVHQVFKLKCTDYGQRRLSRFFPGVTHELHRRGVFHGAMLGVRGNCFLESSLSIPSISLANHRGLDPKFNVGSLLHAPKN